MRDQSRRDAVTVDIASGLTVFALITGFGIGLLIALDLSVGLSEEVGSTLFYVVVGCASALMVRYLYRRRGRADSGRSAE